MALDFKMNNSTIRKMLLLLLMTNESGGLRAPVYRMQRGVEGRLGLQMSANEEASYQLAGLWRLTRCQLDDGLEARLVSSPRIEPAQISWSGNQWKSQRRTMPPKVSRLVINLNERGTFSTLADAEQKVRGVWSVKGRELSLATFGKYGSNVEEWYSGKLASNGSSAGGTMAYGNSEPEYSGTFSMKRAMPQLDPVKKIMHKKKSTLLFNTSQLIGKWSLEFTSSTSYSVFVLELKPDLSWTSISGISSLGNSALPEEEEKPRLAGKWNVFEDSINLGSGIPGSGSKLFIWLRRFGSTSNNKFVSKGVSITHDQLYMGKIHKNTDAAVKDVRGSVAIGWSTEPVFIGRFHLKRWYEEDSLSNFTDIA